MALEKQKLEKEILFLKNNSEIKIQILNTLKILLNTTEKEKLKMKKNLKIL